MNNIFGVRFNSTNPLKLQCCSCFILLFIFSFVNAQNIHTNFDDLLVVDGTAYAVRIISITTTDLYYLTEAAVEESRNLSDIDLFVTSERWCAEDPSLQDGINGQREEFQVCGKLRYVPPDFWFFDGTEVLIPNDSVFEGRMLDTSSQPEVLFFPQELPKPTMSGVLSRTRNISSNTSLYDIGCLVRNKINDIDFGDVAFYTFDNNQGFIALSQLRAINSEGRAKRSSAAFPSRLWFQQLMERALLYSENYRLIVFAITKSDNFLASLQGNPELKNIGQVEDELINGAPSFLPEEYRNQPFDNQYHIYILIYDYKSKIVQVFYQVPSSRAMQSMQEVMDIFSFSEMFNHVRACP